MEGGTFYISSIAVLAHCQTNIQQKPVEGIRNPVLSKIP